jgi:mRNA-degrading endonuclease RelE of RelBE toxin-antitoxin system
MSYQGVYTARFEKRYRTFQNIQPRIEKVVEQILANPYERTERLTQKSGFNLKGCRSARIGRNFRIIFVICAECRQEPACEYCFCEGLADDTVVFLTVGPHAQAYVMH